MKCVARPQSRSALDSARSARPPRQASSNTEIFLAVVCGAIFLKINVNEAIDTADRATDRRVQVLEATVRVISERGAERTRLADVSRAAEVSIGLIQHYFGSRDDLLAAAFEFFNDLWIRGWEGAAVRRSGRRSRT